MPAKFRFNEKCGNGMEHDRRRAGLVEVNDRAISICDPGSGDVIRSDDPGHLGPALSAARTDAGVVARWNPCFVPGFWRDGSCEAEALRASMAAHPHLNRLKLNLRISRHTNGGR